MKKIIIFLSVLAALPALWGQKNEGVVSYKMEIQAPPIFEQLSKNAQSKLPMTVSHKVNVYFKDQWVRYEDTSLVIKQKKPYEVAYKNSEAGWFIDKGTGVWYLLHQLDGKVYYAEEPLNSPHWRFTVSLYDATPEVTTKYQRQIHKINDAPNIKFTDETKIILGYACKKAIYQPNSLQLDGVPDNEGMEIWYTESLPDWVSPVPCNLINGAILELKQQRIHYTATRVSLLPIPKTAVMLPQDGIKITIDTEEAMIDRYMLKRD